MYYNKLLYYEKYTPKYGFIVSHTAEKCKKNFNSGWGNGFSKVKNDKCLRGVSVFRPETKCTKQSVKFQDRSDRANGEYQTGKAG